MLKSVQELPDGVLPDEFEEELSTTLPADI